MKNKHGLIRQHQSKLSTLYQILDISIIGLGMLVSCWAFGAEWNETCLMAVGFASGLMVFIAMRHDLYRSWRIYPIRQEILELLSVWSQVLIAMLVISFALKTTDDFPRLLILSWIVFTPAMMIVSRFILRRVSHRLRQQGWNSRNVAIIGANTQGVQFAQTLKNGNWMGLRLVGFYDDRVQDDRVVQDIDSHVLGNLDDIVAHAREGKIDSVYITMPFKAEDRTKELIKRLSDTTVSLYYVPNFHALDILHGRWSTLGDMPIVSIFESPHHGVDGWAKRAEDIFIAASVLAVIAIPMLIIAIGVKLSSPGPVIFKQRRYGINGEEIEVWKFRSMTVCEDGSSVKQATKCDVRVTKFGAFLRRTSLDELPQFINVLQGRMSIVGPRPHAVAHNEEYRTLIHRYMLRHKVKPGITGWAQVNGWRGETDSIEKMQKRIEHDLEYIRQWSLWLDVKIFAMTFFKGFSNKNAY